MIPVGIETHFMTWYSSNICFPKLYMSREPRSSGWFSHFLFSLFPTRNETGRVIIIICCCCCCVIFAYWLLKVLHLKSREKYSCWKAFLFFLVWENVHSLPSCESLFFLTITSLSFGEGKYLFTNSCFCFLFLLLLYNVWEKGETGWAWMLHQYHQQRQRKKRSKTTVNTHLDRM